MSEATKLYCECGRCGHRWAVMELPASLESVGRIRPQCPNCGETRKLYMCATDGPGAVTEPRQGSPSLRKKSKRSEA